MKNQSSFVPRVTVMKRVKVWLIIANRKNVFLFFEFNLNNFFL